MYLDPTPSSLGDKFVKTLAHDKTVRTPTTLLKIMLKCKKLQILQENTSKYLNLLKESRVSYVWPGVPPHFIAKLKINFHEHSVADFSILGEI